MKAFSTPVRLIAAAAVAMAAAACSSAVEDNINATDAQGEAQESSEPKEGGDAAEGDRVVIVMADEPDSLDPCDASNSTRSRVLRRNVTEALTYRNPSSGEVEGLLATDWTSNDDYTEWVFQLQDGVTFHDGEPFNAEAVVTAIDRMFIEELACDDTADFFNPPGVTATASGPSEVTLALSEPDPIFPLRMTYVQIGSPNTPTDSKGAPAVGTGPYRITEWAEGEQIDLERFEDYWGETPSIANAQFQWRSESPVRVGMVETGEADLAHGIAAQDAEGAPNLQSFENGETTYFRMDAGVEPLSDVRVRRALNLALDRQAIIDSSFGGFGVPAHEMFGASTLGYNDDLEPWPYDPEESQRLVEEAANDGIDIGREIILTGRPDFYPNAREVTEIVESMWEALGLNITIENVEVEPWADVLLRPHPEGRPPGILQSSHGNTTGDASFTVYAKYHCEGSQSASCNEDFSELVDQAIATAPENGRDELFQEALAMQRNEIVQNAPLAHMEGLLATSDRLSYEATINSDFELQISQMELD